MAGRIARGDVRLYQFAPPDRKRPVVVLTRDSAIAYGCADYVHNSRRALGSRAEQTEWHEGRLRAPPPSLVSLVQLSVAKA
jgi:mRNA-degrading endonuclease toxin of MazEF toxin-antitoxin module